jgi:predicted ribosome quality control (RQC) complex YloA/Tae2 family protein
LIFAQAAEVSGLLHHNKLRRAESGDSWLALLFHGDRVLFFSWDAEWYGLCSAEPGEVRALAQLASSRPTLLSAIKSHLLSAELSSARALYSDRLLEIEFRRAIGAGIHQARRLIFEASGRYSNLVLLDDEGLIIEAAKHVYPETNRYRSIIPGHPYIPPPPIAGIKPEDFAGRADLFDNFDKLDQLAGIGKPLINAIKKKYVNSGEPSHILVDDIIKSFRDPCANICQKLGSYVTIFPTLLDEARRLDTSSALVAARECVILPLLRRHTDRARKKIGDRLDQLTRANAKKIAEAEALTKDESIAGELMRCGRLILANIWMIPPRAAEADLPEWTQDGAVLRRVALDPERDASGNAEHYFARYKKKRAAAERAKGILPKLLLERNELQEQAALLDCHTDAITILMMTDELSPGANPAKVKKAKTSTQPPHRRYEFEWAGAVLFIGLSASGNHYVTFRLATSDDIWLHTWNAPGAHVILRFTSKPDPETYEEMLEIAASAAVYHSKLREGGRTRVDYAERRHVRAITGAGPAQVTYKEFSSINADPSQWLGSSRRS